MKVEHTPIPWETNGGKSIFAGPKQVALMRASNSGWLNNLPCASESEANANAAFIVRAVNNFEKERAERYRLLHQLKKVTHQLKMRSERTEAENKTIATAEKTIAKAEGK